MVSTLPAPLRRMGWFFAIAIVSIGAAGLIVSLDHAQTDAGRPELTARGDERLARHVPMLREAVARLAVEADAIASAAREASRSLRLLDPDAARRAIGSSDALLAEAETASATLTGMRQAALADLADGRLSATNELRLTQIEAAEAEAATLPGALAGITASVAFSAEVLEGMQRHDALVFEATTLARGENYAQALTSLARADAELEELRLARESLAARNAPTLDEWLLRAADYNEALSRLYRLLDASDGSPTVESQAALRDVEAAQAALPASTDAFVIVVTEISEPALTENQVRIERVRGQIGEAAATLD